MMYSRGPNQGVKETPNIAECWDGARPILEVRDLHLSPFCIHDNMVEPFASIVTAIKWRRMVSPTLGTTGGGTTWPTAWHRSLIPVHFACNYVEGGRQSPTEADFTVLAPTVHPVGSPQQS